MPLGFDWWLTGCAEPGLCVRTSLCMHPEHCARKPLGPVGRHKVPPGFTPQEAEGQRPKTELAGAV